MRLAWLQGARSATTYTVKGRFGGFVSDLG